MTKSPVRILVVDDEIDIREYLAELLLDEGYETETAANGEEAWALLNQKDYGLVITDIVMPACDGLELLNRIRTRHNDKPGVILISAFARISVQEAYERGAAAFFPKPFLPGPLLKVVSRCLTPQHDRWRRTSERIELDKDISLSLAVPNLLAATYSASVLNIGQGGMFLAWGAELPKIGDVIQFKISFLNRAERAFEGRGTVRWIRHNKDDESRLPGVGIEFLELADEQVSEIFEVLNYVQTREFIPRG